MRRAHTGEGGQASVELVALLPLIVLVGALLWQAVVAGQALWLSGAAARAAARATAVGGDAEAAARGALPPRFDDGVHVSAAKGGKGVRVTVPIPSVISRGAIASVESSASFPEQRP